MRTARLDLPGSWRAWGGSAYDVRFVDPYTSRQPGRPAASGTSSACIVPSASGLCAEGWGGRSVRVEQAQGILVAALGVLAGHYGYDVQRVAFGR